MSVSLDEANIEEMFRDPDGPIGRIVERFCFDVETVAKVLMMAPGGGRFYPAGEYYLRRGHKLYHWTRTSAHTASAPGEPASSDSGRAMNAISHKLEVHDVITGKVTMGVNYAEFIERGTRYMLPRPVMFPALEAGMKS